MKIMIEITGLASGQAGDKKWLRMLGRDGRGKHVTAVCFDQLADTIGKTISKMIPEGADVASQRLLVDLVGEFRDGKQVVKAGKPVTKGDGTPLLSRSFFIENFRLLTGPMLEMARMRRDADARLTKAEKMGAVGDFTGAYRVLGEFVASICSRPFELVDHNSDDLDDEEFGDTETLVASASSTSSEDRSQANPEAAAAEVFAREDAMMDQAAKNEARSAIKSPSEDAPAAPQDVLDDPPASPVDVDSPSIDGSSEEAPQPSAKAVNDQAEKEAAPAPAAQRRPGFGRRL